MRSGKKSLRRLVCREEGVVSVEMVILFPLLALIVVGLVEMGNLWFVRQAIANASREGARAAAVYYRDPNAADETARLAARKTWAETTAKTTVANYLTDTRFPEACPPAQVEFAADASGNQLITVTVTSPNGLILLPKLLSEFAKISNLTAETTMRLE